MLLRLAGRNLPNKEWKLQTQNWLLVEKHVSMCSKPTRFDARTALAALNNTQCRGT